MIGVDTTFLVQLEIAETPLHAAAHTLLKREVLDAGVELAIVPQILAEFLHVVTDPKRFLNPLSMPHAVSRAEFWWSAREVTHIHATDASTRQFLTWISDRKLGRKRLLDTQLAATLWSRGIRKLITSNSKDFAPFGFQILSP
jgi:predicted nucleic acid-binding protein